MTVKFWLETRAPYSWSSVICIYLVTLRHSELGLSGYINVQGHQTNYFVKVESPEDLLRSVCVHSVVSDVL